MTSEIKQRIEQIRRGEVPEEYKKFMVICSFNLGPNFLSRLYCPI